MGGKKEQIRIFTSTASKPDVFENRVNQYIERLAVDEEVTDYQYDISLADGTLIAIFRIKKG